jgi:F-type H+-transporting ATPase subunit delta
MSLLARRYATALFLSVRDRAAADAAVATAVEEQLAGIHATVADQAVRALLQSPDLVAADRERIIGKIVEGKHELLQGLLAVLQRRRRLDVLFDIYPEYRGLALAARGEVEGVVETPRQLGESELQSISALADKLSGKSVSLVQQIVPELIGGVRLRVGNILYDGSVQSSLAQLEQKLMQAPV